MALAHQIGHICFFKLVNVYADGWPCSPLSDGPRVNHYQHRRCGLNHPSSLLRKCQGPRGTKCGSHTGRDRIDTNSMLGREADTVASRNLIGAVGDISCRTPVRNATHLSGQLQGFDGRRVIRKGKKAWPPEGGYICRTIGRVKSSLRILKDARFLCMYR